MRKLGADEKYLQSFIESDLDFPRTLSGCLGIWASYWQQTFGIPIEEVTKIIEADVPKALRMMSYKLSKIRKYKILRTI